MDTVSSRSVQVAIQRLTVLDEKMSNAVEARRELDLRIGEIPADGSAYVEGLVID